MPHLSRHALDGIGVSTLSKLLIAYVKDHNDANCDQQSFHPKMLPMVLAKCMVEAAWVAATIPAPWSGPRSAPDPAIGSVLTVCSRVPSRPQDGRSRASAWE